MDGTGPEVDTGESQPLHSAGGHLRLIALGPSSWSAAQSLPPLGSVVIGRSSSADVRLPDASVSRRHALLHLEPLGIEDLGSANGTWVNQRRVLRGAVANVSVGDSLRIGDVTVLVQRAPPKAERPVGPLVLDSAMRELYRVLDQVASSALAVLITGETGVGKELFAQELHRRSQRAARPYVVIHCAALPESLFEAALFGHEKGAFTGAAEARPGLIESADGGTVFLDEIGEISLGLQPKLLRVLEERSVLRVGALRPRPVDVRFVAATNRDLDDEVAAGRFRQDLFFRLAGVSLRVPALRERPDEIVPLANAFLEAATAGRARPALSPDAEAALRAHSWPGNVRELKNAVERAALLAGSGPIVPAHLLPPAPSRLVTPLTVTLPSQRPVPPPALPAELFALERKRIVDALEKCSGNQSRAAELLGISRRALIYKLEQHGLPRPRKRD